MAQKDIPGVIAPPPLIFGGFLLAGLLWHGLIGGLDLPLSYPERMLGGGAFIIIGVTFLVLAVTQFRAVGTPPEPWEESRALATGGIYRLTRNPMYLGMAFAYFGIAFWVGCGLTLALLVPALVTIQRGVIDREEAYLERKFGEPYRRFKASSRRWL